MTYGRMRAREVTLCRKDYTLLWEALTDSSGKVSLNLALTKFNYTHTFYLRPAKGNLTFTEEIRIPHLHPQPKVVTIPEFPTWVLLMTILFLITVSLVTCKRRLLKTCARRMRCIKRT